MTSPRGRRPRRPAVTLLAAALLALAGCSGGSAAAVPGQGFVSGDGSVTQVAVADRKDAVSFRGTTLEGQPYDVRDDRGRVVVVNVWGSWCAPCIAEAPALQAVHELTQGQDVSFVGINTKDGGAAARAHEKRFGVTYPSIDDDGGRVLLDLRGSLPPSAIPSTLVLDREGRVAARILGKTDRTVLSGVVADVVAEDAA
jgi:thiol-disulfide isomerase/thioredoxin